MSTLTNTVSQMEAVSSSPYCCCCISYVMMSLPVCPQSHIQSTSDRIQFNDLQSLLCATLQVRTHTCRLVSHHVSIFTHELKESAPGFRWSFPLTHVAQSWSWSLSDVFTPTGSALYGLGKGWALGFLGTLYCMSEVIEYFCGICYQYYTF